MLEAPFAIVALCGPSINQLVARAVKHRNLTSLFSSRRTDTSLIGGSGGASAKRDVGISGGSFREIESSSAKKPHLGATTTSITTSADEGGDDWRAQQDIPMHSIHSMA